MFNVRAVSEDVFWVGANDHRLHLFENIHPIPRGVSYNAYLLRDQKTVLFDTVDWSACRQLLENLEHLLGDKPLDYLVVNHMEPDHAASLDEIILRYPDVEIISTEKAFLFMHQFGVKLDGVKQRIVKEGDTQSFGKHEVMFIAAPMVHWPETMVTFDKTNGALYSADAFGTFGALDGKLFADEVNFERDWLDEARRYYTNIVGKYGPHVMHLLKKAEAIDIKMILPLHGPVWRKDLGWFIDKYSKWASYEPEEKGILLVYASMYGNTESAAQALASRLCEKGITNIQMYDVSKTHVSYLISDAFKLSHIVVASVTYNLNIYPVMYEFLEHMRLLNVKNRTVAIVENGSWAPRSGDLMQEYFEKQLKNMTVINERLSLASALPAEKELELNQLVDAISESMK